MTPRGLWSTNSNSGAILLATLEDELAQRDILGPDYEPVRAHITGVKASSNQAGGKRQAGSANNLDCYQKTATDVGNDLTDVIRLGEAIKKRLSTCSRTPMFVSLIALGVILLALVEAGNPTRGLFRRQSSSTGGPFDPSQIPTQCQPACNSVIDSANTCTTFQCLCTPANDAAVLSCVDCVTSFNHSGTAIVDGQDILNQFASQCNLNNISVSSLSASGVATVTGVTTSNLNPPLTSSALPTSSASHSGSVTSPSIPTSSAAAPSTTPNRAAAIILGWDPYSSLWSCYATLIAVGFVMVLGNVV
ncbi:hypothetical protein MVEN_02365600 [Mycena venus]|uniref:Uncharacterized protein n=1 Tax=Mycena venus TaxID=2733690 RepID=A0A8H6X3C7_9AGAR|nr:hypothetical protein MVEN_02365600 [Mycena venus]